MPDDDSLVVIASYLRTEEAGMLRGLLESAGIAAVVRDEVLSGINPFLQSAIGGVKLAVRAADADRALEIIGSAGVPWKGHGGTVLGAVRRPWRRVVALSRVRFET